MLTEHEPKPDRQHPNCVEMVAVLGIMIKGRTKSTRWITGIVLGLLCCGIVSGEIHTVFGHPQTGRSHPIQTIECSSASGLKITASENNCEGGSCGICCFCQLLNTILTPQSNCFFDSPFTARIALIQNSYLIKANLKKEENRGPPQA
jgi:hypothetical protein